MTPHSGLDPEPHPGPDPGPLNTNDYDPPRLHLHPHQQTQHNTTLYIGVTRNLQRRIAEHKLHINNGFSSKYNTDKLVYYESYDRLDTAIKREKQLKNWHRAWKDKLINDLNPQWNDLSEEIGADPEHIQSVNDAHVLGYHTHSE